MQMTNPTYGHTQSTTHFAPLLGGPAPVDRMSGCGFPVEHVRIVGDGVRTSSTSPKVMTKGKAALAGSASGAWFGVIVGLLFAIVVVGPLWLWMVLVAVVVGAIWGAIFGFAAHWSTRGRRDFSSVQTLRAQRYDVYVAAEHAAEAARYVESATTGEQPS